MRETFKKWIYPAHIDKDNEADMFKFKAATNESYNKIINDALREYLKSKIKK